VHHGVIHVPESIQSLVEPEDVMTNLTIFGPGPTGSDHVNRVVLNPKLDIKLFVVAL